MRIEIWTDIACPWCYIGLTRFERALADFDHGDEVAVVLRSFQLDADMPDSYPGSEAEYLAAAKGIAPEDARAMTGQVADIAAAEGLVLDFDSLRVANSRRAHRLLQAARRQDPTGRLAGRLEHALFRAHFSQGESISDPEVLVHAAAGAGMAEPDAREAVGSEELDAAVAADVAAAAELGIRGVPFFAIDRRWGVSGAQSQETFAAALRRAWDESAAAQASYL